jgi:hypothetical protein
MILPLALALLQPAFPAPQASPSKPTGNPVRLIDNGFCAGLTWVTLRPGETVKLDIGPDFNVYHVTGPGKKWWGVYSGFAASAKPDEARPLLKRADAAVFRATEEGRFEGYLVYQKDQQNHFFGSVFADAPGDADFFSRVEFGATAQAKCARQSPQ